MSVLCSEPVSPGSEYEVRERAHDACASVVTDYHAPHAESGAHNCRDSFDGITRAPSRLIRTSMNLTNA